MDRNLQNSPVLSSPQSIQNDVELMQSMWRQCRRLDVCFNTRLYAAPNPFLYVLDLLYHISKNNISGLAPAVIKDYELWLQRNQSAFDNLTFQLKVFALDIIMTNQSGPFIEKMCQLFQMEKDVEKLKPVIDQHLKLKKFKQVCYVVIALNLQDSYPFEKILHPLMSQNKMVMVNQYCQNNKDLQLRFAKNLDDICSNDESVEEAMKLINVSQDKRSCWNLRWLQKALAAFLKKFNIPIEHCPNLLRKRSQGAINYLFHKRFVEESISEASWKEMMVSTISDDPELTKEILIRLVSVDETDLAVEMATLFKVPPIEWPDSLHIQLRLRASRLIKENKDVTHEQNDESWDDEIKVNVSSNSYLKLRLNLDDIILIDTLAGFESNLEEISKSYDVLGIDAEWRPHMGITSEIVSLMQIATWDNVYLFDILVLLDILNEDHWHQFINRIFCNPEIVKLGYGIWGDIDMLLKTLQHTIIEKPKFASVLDLGCFLPKLRSTYPDISFQKIHDQDINDNEDGSNNFNRGLSKVCEVVLGSPLDKAEQFSDWKRRPLRESQIYYASLDAYCLLQIFETLFHTVQDMGLNLQELIKEYFKTNPSKPEKAKTSKLEQKHSFPELSPDFQFPQQPISQFKVLVDNCISGLGKQLRTHGADVIILGDQLSVSDLIKLGEKEERYILSTGSRYKKIRGYFPAEMCLCISHQDAIARQAAFVCKYFNIVCTENDIFSRCTLCNCDRYLKISSEDMQLLWAIRNSSSPTKQGTNELEPLIVCDNGFVTEDGVMDTGVQVQIDGLSSDILLRGLMFFVCSNCGKVYWEGSHHKRTKRMLSNWISGGTNPDEDESCLPLNEILSASDLDSSVSSHNETTNDETSAESSTPILCADTYSDEDDDDDMYDFVY